MRHRSGTRLAAIRLALAAALLATSFGAGQAADQPAADRAHALAAAGHDPVLGKPDGKHLIVEYFDYRCPYCRRLEKDLQARLAQDPEVRIVLKEWPILGEASVYAARAALAAGWQGKFEALHTALFAHVGPLDQAMVRKVAAEAGLDMARLDADLAAHGAEIDALLARVNAEAKSLQFKGTPGLVVGDMVVPGAVSRDDLDLLLTEPSKGGAK